MGKFFGDKKTEQEREADRRNKAIIRLAKKYECLSDEVIDELNDRWDSSITFDENLTNIEAICRDRGKPPCPTEREVKAKQQELKEAQVEAEEQKREERRREYIGSIDTSANDLDRYFDVPITLINTLMKPRSNLTVKCEVYKALILESSAGLGKTITTEKELKRLGYVFGVRRTPNSEGKIPNYTKIKGHITALKMYQKCYEFKDEDCVIVIDDVYEMFENIQIISMLLGMLWEDGYVCWESTSDKLGDYPTSYEFKGKMIILTNHIPEWLKKSKHFLSRCHHHLFEFSYKEKIEMMYVMAKQMNVPIAVIDWIWGITSGQKIKDGKVVEQNEGKIVVNNKIDFRTLSKVYDIYEKNPTNWKAVAKASLFGQDDLTRILMEILKRNLTPTEQVEEWERRTGRKKSDFYGRKKELELEVEIENNQLNQLKEVV